MPLPRYGPAEYSTPTPNTTIQWCPRCGKLRFLCVFQDVGWLYAGLCVCSVRRARAPRHIMLWMRAWNKVTFCLSGEQSGVSECCLSSSCTVESARDTWPFTALAIMFLQAKINYGGQTQYQMKKGFGGNHMSRWARIQRCLDLCHWISIDNHIREANGVADSIVEMFSRGW